MLYIFFSRKNVVQSRTLSALLELLNNFNRVIFAEFTSRGMFRFIGTYNRPEIIPPGVLQIVSITITRGEIVVDTGYCNHHA